MFLQITPKCKNPHFGVPLPPPFWEISMSTMFFTINTIISWSAVSPAGELWTRKKEKKKVFDVSHECTAAPSSKGHKKLSLFKTWDPQLWSIVAI